MFWALTPSIPSTWLQVALPAVCSFSFVWTESQSAHLGDGSLVWSLIGSVECLQVHLQLLTDGYFRTTRACTCLYSEFACLPGLVFLS